ncbi:MAG: AmmeMemoRadiSam system radical SAM enzyme [Elusimicrobia bacterium]|nr:AmmeMemoRadiSam system radical SAM enzyme [Candidatus Obscuribacterium magneticum]
MKPIDQELKGKGLHPTKYWHQTPEGRIQCDICPRACQLSEGQRGFCFVRQCLKDQVVLTTYGFSSGFCVDPIEKKPLFHFLPGTPTLSFGTAGCNLGCLFCQNWDLSKSREMDTLTSEASPEEIAKTALKNGCPSVSYTYNDPVIFMEYAIDTAIACKEAGLKSVAVTAGYLCDEPRREFFRHMDAANVDLKAFTERFYNKLCSGHLQPVLDTLVYLKKETNVWLEITTLLIPGENDSEEEMNALTQWVFEKLGPDVPLHFSAFHPAWKLTGKPPTPPSSLVRARDIALKNDLHYVYTGNVHHEEGESTYCVKCGKRLIGRDWFTLTEWNLNDKGACASCGQKVTGVFEGAAGTWGARRRAIGI